MAGIRWGKLSGGKNRGGTCNGGKARKCEISEAQGSAKGKEGDQGIKKKRGLFRSRCSKSSMIVVDTLMKIKGELHLCSKTLQEEGIAKNIDAYDARREHNHPVSGVIVKTDACKNSLDIPAIGSESKKATFGIQSVPRRKFAACEKGVDAGRKRKGEDDGNAKCRRDLHSKKGMCMSEALEYVNQGICGYGWMEDVRQGKREGECKVDAKQRTRGNACVKQSMLGMEQGGNMAHVGHRTSVKKEKKIDSPARCIDKDGDATEAANKTCGSLLRRGLDSKSMKGMQSTADLVKVEQKNVYVNADSELAMSPHDFICGISKEVMADPVVIASGQTFERVHIQAWLDAGNTLCPMTHQPLSHQELIPNLTLKALISAWHSRCRGSGLESTDQSFASCVSSFSSCPNLPSPHLLSPHHPRFVSCASFSVSRLLQEAELCSSSLSSSLLLPKLLLGMEVDSLSSRTIHAPPSSTPEHRTAASIHNVPSTPSSSGSTSSSRDRGEDEIAMKKHCKWTDSMLQSENSCTYPVSRIKSLVSDLESAYPDIQRSAAAELRLLAKHDDNKRLLIASMGALRPLMALVWSRDRSVQLEATTALLNLTLNHSLGNAIVKEGAIEALVGVLRDGCGVVAKENAAVTLACLAHSEQNKVKIGSAGAVKPLVNLLERGSLRGKKDAAAALYRLSSHDENKGRIVRAGALRPLVDFMCDEHDKDGMVDKAIAILGKLVSIEAGRVAFVEEKGILSLMRVLQTGSERSKGLAISVLSQLCTHSSKHRSLVLQKEPLPTLMALSKLKSVRLKTQVAEVIQVLIVDAD